MFVFFVKIDRRCGRATDERPVVRIAASGGADKLPPPSFAERGTLNSSSLMTSALVRRMPREMPSGDDDDDEWESEEEG